MVGVCRVKRSRLAGVVLLAQVAAPGPRAAAESVGVGSRLLRCACVPACVCVRCVRVRVHTYTHMHACMHAYIHTYLHTSQRRRLADSTARPRPRPLPSALREAPARRHARARRGIVQDRGACAEAAGGHSACGPPLLHGLVLLRKHRRPAREPQVSGARALAGWTAQIAILPV